MMNVEFKIFNALLLFGFLEKYPVIIKNKLTEIGKIKGLSETVCSIATLMESNSLNNSIKANLFLFLKIPNFSHFIVDHLLLKADVFCAEFKS
jgi:hypothetical protein